MDESPQNGMNRRNLIKGFAATGVWVIGTKCIAAPVKFLTPLHVDNPLKFYPNRDWEKIPRSVFDYDSTFHFLCAPIS